MSSGTVDKVTGKVKEIAGQVTGDKRLESEGKAGQVKGEVRNATDSVTEVRQGRTGQHQQGIARSGGAGSGRALLLRPGPAACP